MKYQMTYRVNPHKQQYVTEVEFKNDKELAEWLARQDKLGIEILKQKPLD